MQEIENTTNETENIDSESYEMVGYEETPSTDTVNLSNNLRVENSSSINLLGESAKLLSTSAASLLGDYTGDFGEGAIRKPTYAEAEAALKLALGANELMKTKLEYIKTGKSLINDMYELLEIE